MSKKVDFKTVKRLFSYIIKRYKIQFIFVMILVLISSAVTVISSLFLESLVDDYIEPMLRADVAEFSPLLKALMIMAVIYIVGVLSNYLYNRIMAVISQGTLRNIRNEMFEKMQRLPIKYFDTHLHGDIMSHYTNDIDTLRELITRGIPQIFNLTITILMTVIAMITTNIYLTFLVLIIGAIMIFVTKNIGGKSSTYFIRQQETLGKVDGYIEEMINAQKVIKVFSHEEESKDNFKKMNDELYEDTKNANSYANILMPALANLGNLLYVLVGVVGGALLINNIGGITLGIVVSFVNLSKNFSMPIAQLSQQINSIVMAIARC